MPILTTCCAKMWTQIAVFQSSRIYARSSNVDTILIGGDNERP